MQVECDQNIQAAFFNPVKTFNGLNLLFKKKICQK